MKQKAFWVYGYDKQEKQAGKARPYTPILRVESKQLPLPAVVASFFCCCCCLPARRRHPLKYYCPPQYLLSSLHTCNYIYTYVYKFYTVVFNIFSNSITQQVEFFIIFFSWYNQSRQRVLYLYISKLKPCSI